MFSPRDVYLEDYSSLDAEGSVTSKIHIDISNLTTKFHISDQISLDFKFHLKFRISSYISYFCGHFIFVHISMYILLSFYDEVH